MAYEVITLNLIPSGEVPVIHAAQFDKNRPLMFALKLGTDDFNPSGYTLELQIRKVDNNIVTAAPASTTGNVVTFNSTEQMTACSGTNLGEIQITKDDMDIATLHFYLVVQRDVLAGGVSSASDIYNLTEQIAAIVPEVIGDDYYNKEEVDEKIAEIPTFDPTNYYDKADVNSLLNDKANTADLAAVAFSGDYDDLENKPVIPDVSNYYTKSEVDTKISDMYQIKNVSGNVVNIMDGGDGIPVKLLTSDIVAVETGTGEKSPENPYTISGFDSGVITRCGKNLLNIDEFKNINNWSTSYPDGGSIPASNANPIYSFGKLIAGQTYTLSFEYAEPNFPQYLYFGYYDNEGVTTRIIYFTTNQIFNRSYTFTALENVYYCVRVQGSTAFDTNMSYINKCQFEFGMVTDFEAYNGNTYTFTFGQTVYGGHFDNKGNLVVTHSFIASYNGETINEPWISSMDNYVPNTSPSIGAEVVYPLTTPITLSITSQDIPTLLGENNIFSNTGDVEVNYFTSKSDGIAELIKAFM